MDRDRPGFEYRAVALVDDPRRNSPRQQVGGSTRPAGPAPTTRTWQSGRAARRAFCISFMPSTFRLAAAIVI
jgi:hypothetical protein